MSKYIFNSSQLLISPSVLADQFGCVIFIETYQKRMVPVDADKGLRKTWFEGYSHVKEFYSPDYSSEPIDSEDYRRTLYWNPMVATGENGVAKLKFYNSSNCKRFSVSAETVTAEGAIGVNF
jgi:hypothetical protein